MNNILSSQSTFIKHSSQEVIESAKNILTPAKGKGNYKYICPLCEGTIYIKDYMACYGHNGQGCEWQELSDYIYAKMGWQTWAEFDKERKQERWHNHNKKTLSDALPSPQSKQPSKQSADQLEKRLADALVPGKGLIQKDYDEFAKSALPRELANKYFQRIDNHGNRNSDLIAFYLGWKGYGSKSEEAPGGWVFTDDCGGKGQFKPDTPLPRVEGGGNPLKYITPKSDKADGSIFVGAVKKEVAPGRKALSKIWNSDEVVSIEMVKANPEIPVIITEGGKKGIKLAYYFGSVCIVLSGVEMGLLAKDKSKGYKGGEKTEREFIDAIKQFITIGRNFIICFDADWREKLGVSGAMRTLGKALLRNQCNVYVMSWADTQQKGVDDYLYYCQENNIEPQFEFDTYQQWRDKYFSFGRFNGKLVTITDDPDYRSNRPYLYVGELPKGNEKADVIKRSIIRKNIQEALISYHESGSKSWQSLQLKALKVVGKDYRIRGYSKMSKYELAMAIQDRGISPADYPEYFAKTKSKPIQIKVVHSDHRLIVPFILDLNSYGKQNFNVFLACSSLGNNFVKLSVWKHLDFEAVNGTADWANYQRMNSFSPDLVTTTDFLTNDKKIFNSLNPLDGGVHCVKSPLGTGKTKFVNQIIENVVRENRQKGKDEVKINVMLLSHRIGLNTNTLANLDKHLFDQFKEQISYYTAEEFKEKYGNRKKTNPCNGFILAGCFNSIESFLDGMSEESQKNTLIITDEWDGTVTELYTGSTIKRNRVDVLDAMRNFMSGCQGILALSGTINDLSCSYFVGIKQSIRKYQNDLQREPMKVRFLAGRGGVVDPNTKIQDIKDKDFKSLLDGIYTDICAGNNVIAILDPQKKCEELEEWALAKFCSGDNPLMTPQQIVRIDGKSRQKKESLAIIQEVLKDPERLHGKDGFIPGGCRLFIFNSSIESGVDISFKGDYQKYFAHCYCFWFGVVGCTSVIQMLRRYRHQMDITLWANPSSFNYEKIRDIDYENEQKRIEAGITSYDPDQQDHKIAQQLLWMRNYERKYPRQCLIWQLQQHGYDVEIYTATDKSKNALSDYSEMVEDRFISEILSASDRYIDEDLSEIRKQESMNFDDAVAVKKATWLQMLGINGDEYAKMKLIPDLAFGLADEEMILENNQAPAKRILSQEEVDAILNDDQQKLFDSRFLRTVEFKERDFLNRCRNRVLVRLSINDLKAIQMNKYFNKPFLSDVSLLIHPMETIQNSGILTLIDLLHDSPEAIKDSNPIFGEIGDYAKKHWQRWQSLTGQKYSDKEMIPQLKSILSSKFGYELTADVLESGAIKFTISDGAKRDEKGLADYSIYVSRLSAKINSEVFSAKAFLHYEDENLFPEVENDERWEEYYQRRMMAGDGLIDESVASTNYDIDEMIEEVVTAPAVPAIPATPEKPIITKEALLKSNIRMPASIQESFTWEGYTFTFLRLLGENLDQPTWKGDDREMTLISFCPVTHQVVKVW